MISKPARLHNCTALRTTNSTASSTAVTITTSGKSKYFPLNCVDQHPMVSSNYNADAIEVLTGLEPVRKRP
ncbi:MAG TPA: hypothetical protein VKB53_00775, partial [Gammaproteobacteria bacterium]|nr:hypothetical protein [Gammaproteobacteria bacterium]